jgi:cell division protein FtsZ
MKIEVISGNIVKQPDAEAIVNSVNVNLRLGSGVAGAIHTAAGSELEVYCRPFAPLALGGTLFRGSLTITIIGIGGFGGEMIRSMRMKQLFGVSLLVADGKYQISEHKGNAKCIQLHPGGLDGGHVSHYEKYVQAAEAEIRRSLEGANILFICAGMGGGAGTGASPAIALIARSLKIPYVAIITMPAKFEGRRRTTTAEAGFQKLNSISTISVPFSSELSLSELNEDATYDDCLQKLIELMSKFVVELVRRLALTDLINLNHESLCDALRFQVSEVQREYKNLMYVNTHEN